MSEGLFDVWSVQPKNYSTSYLDPKKSVNVYLLLLKHAWDILV